MNHQDVNPKAKRIPLIIRFALAWSRLLSKGFQKQLIHSGVCSSILTRFSAFRVTGRVFSQVGSVPAKQLSFCFSASLCGGNFAVVHGAYRKRGARAEGIVCSKAPCSEVLRIFTCCLWESLPALLGSQPKHSERAVEPGAEVRLSGKTNSLHTPTFHAPCL